MKRAKRTRSKRIITLKLPPEFIALCAQDGVTPELVLRGFIADLCGIVSEERYAEGYSSNGSDERVRARGYYDRVGYPYWNPKR